MLKELIEQHQPIHTRDINLSSFPHGDQGIIVHGVLTDRRHLSIVDVLGRPKPPGIVHHMSVTLAIEPDPLRIVDAEAEMLTVPSELCPETLDRIPKLVGLEIKPGFSQAVKERVGGSQGCVHLCSLVKAMGTEIVHGWLTQKRSKETGGSIDIENLKEKMFLIDSCRLWRKDGPRMKALRQAIEEQK